MKRGILFRLMSAFGAVLLLFGVVLGGVFVTLFRSHTIELNRAEMEYKAVSIAETMSSFQTGKGYGYGAFMRYLNELAMAEVWIVDEQLNIYTCGHEKQDVQYTELPENAERIVHRIFSGEVTYGEEFSDPLGTKSMTVGAPIRRNEEVIGAVLVHSAVSGIDEAVRHGLYVLLIGCASALLLAGIVSTILAYHYVHPLYRMKRAAAELTQGNYSARTGVDSGDDMGELAEAIDTLAAHLKQAQMEREEADRMRDGFIANVSHELRTPVAVLRGYLELLEDGTITSPGEIREYYGQMLKESRHMERLVNDLLELSRLQDAGFKLTMEEVNLCNVVSDAVRAIRRTAQPKEITVEASLPDCECIVDGDYGRIRQMLIIFLDNAVKFSSEGGSIEVSLRCENGYVIRVTDHGIGIPKEQISHVFERFYKSDSERNKNGSGLGLAIAGEIARRHNAKILAHSDPSETVFEVIFSCAQMQQEAY